MIADALNDKIKAERSGTAVTVTGLAACSSRWPNGPLMARTPPSKIRTGASSLVEPRGFEPLTPGLQSRS
ncbi:hypothetical protein GCM10010208_25890 [Actinomadura livida]|nr:hypothetical protein GCM10010208_25890 [Actinomadura livida]